MSILTSFFSSRLISLGYPKSLDINYSLGHCQGDGVAFYGELNSDSLSAIANRIYSSETYRVCADDGMTGEEKLANFNSLADFVRENGFSSFKLSITRNSFGRSGYSHAYTMNVEDETSFLEDGKHRDTLDVLIKDIGDDIVNISECLADQGYVLQDSGCFEPIEVRRFKTKNLLVKIEFIESSFFDSLTYSDATVSFDDCEAFDDKNDIDLLLSGDYKYGAYKVSIFIRSGFTIIGSALTDGLVIKNGDLDRFAINEALTESVLQARDYFNNLNSINIRKTA